MEFDDVTDSGIREEYGTGAVRDTASGKGRYDLLPAYAMHRVARHYENGSYKYSDRNWEMGIKLSRFLDSAMRHLFNYLGGSDDEDHLAAAIWNVLGYIETEHRIELGILPEELDDMKMVRTILSNKAQD